VAGCAENEQRAVENPRTTDPPLQQGTPTGSGTHRHCCDAVAYLDGQDRTVVEDEDGSRLARASDFVDAMHAAWAEEPQVVHVLPGRYEVTQTLEVPTELGRTYGVVGSGVYRTVLASTITDGEADVISMSGKSSWRDGGLVPEGETASPRGNVLREFNVLGTGEERDGVHVERFVQSGRLANVMVGRTYADTNTDYGKSLGVGRDGFRFVESWDQVYDSLIASGCGGGGFRFFGVDSSTIQNCYATKNAEHGFNHASPRGACTYLNCKTGYNGQYGFRIKNCRSTTFLNCYPEQDRKGSFRLDDTTSGDLPRGGLKAEIVGCRCTEFVTHGILVNGVQALSIRGTHVDANSPHVSERGIDHVRLTGGAQNVYVDRATELIGDGTGVQVNVEDAADVHVERGVNGDPIFNGEIGRSPSGATARLDFDAPFTREPQLHLQTMGGSATTWSIGEVHRNDRDWITGYTVAFRDASGQPTTPGRVSWRARQL
jgi:hypothetical protein